MLLTGLHYQNGCGWVVMPSWAVSYISLGSAIATPGDPRYRLVIGLAVPIRAYAAALTAMGIVISRAQMSFDYTTESEYLNYVRNIKIGTPMFYRTSMTDSCYPGIFKGLIQDKLGNYSVRVAWQKGKKHILSTIPLREALKRTQVSVNSSMDQRKKVVAHEISFNRELLEVVLDGQNPWDFAFNSRLECVIIGCVNTLRHEIKETEISFGARHIEGTFQDVLRARKFLSEGSAYRSNVIPADREQASLTDNQEIPYAVIFDGAMSFLKWRDYWRQSNWIVLLDKTESCFHEAANQLNNEYVEKRVSDALIENALELPQGIDIISFQEGSE